MAARELVRSLARRLGVADGGETGGRGRAIRVRPARAWLLMGGCWGLALACGSGLAVVVLMDWEPQRLLVGVPIGMVLWGGFAFVEVRRRVPWRRPELLEAPAAVVLERAWDGLLWRLLALVPICAAGAWLADRLDLGPLFVPGQWAGYAAANLVGVGLVARWERRNGVRILVREDGEDTQLYTAAVRTVKPSTLARDAS